MPKIVTARRLENERDRARRYLKSRLIMPTFPLGAAALVAGYGYMLLFLNTLTTGILLGSTILLLFGAMWGWCHTRYERYLLSACPEYFARKQKLFDAAKDYKRVSRDLPGHGPLHPGRQLALAGYAVGVGSMLGMTGYYLDQVGVIPALFLPWAGYFNAKMIFFRDLLRA